uniref:Uncharacterized protein n=1 Tax=Oryza punctata TaxID=4537 RepID=A0A0E0KE03_ORYPU
MAASKAAAANQLEMNDVVNGGAGFDPSMWRDFFVTYTPPLSQACTHFFIFFKISFKTRTIDLYREHSEEQKRARAEQLAGEVRREMFDAGNGKKVSTMSTAEAATLVDTLERLGLDVRFRQEIGVLLGRLCCEEADSAASDDEDDDLHICALRFRLLRQHGLWLSPDVFDKFKDSSGSFSTSLCDDPKGLLSLYNAAHMAIPGETKLDDAIAFVRYHLEAMAMKGELRSPMAEQVARALDIPLPRFPRWLETMNYLTEYKEEDGHDNRLLELAKLDFELARSLHLKELKALSLWWRELYDSVKLSYARDRLVEFYFWICGVFHEEDYSRARIMLAKVFGFLSLMDDTYDVHATLDECHKLNEAIQRWEESAVSILPKYLRVFYIKLLSNFHEMEDSLEPYEKYRVSYARNAFKLSSAYYLREAKWSNDNYTPSFTEHLEVSIMSAYPLLAPAVLMGVHDDGDGAGAASKEAFEWVAAVPDMVSASGEVARFLNDVASYTVRKNRRDVASSVECYMAEHGVDGEAAVAAVAALAERAWRAINGAFVETVDAAPALMPAARLVVSLTRILEGFWLPTAIENQFSLAVT